jgi:hypothetical protein
MCLAQSALQLGAERAMARRPAHNDDESISSHSYGVRVPKRMRDGLEQISRRDAVSVSATIRRLVAVGLRHELDRERQHAHGDDLVAAR